MIARVVDIVVDQDLQAGGKMIVGAVIGLELINNRSKELLAAEEALAA